MKTWLVIDAPNVAWRMFHVMGQLRFGDEQTGVAYGVLREWLRLTQDAAGTGTVWAFDRGVPARARIYPRYKSRRRDDRPEDERIARSACREQIDRLQADLPGLGFSNVFSQEGYEADDIIASVVERLPTGDEAFVVSTDKDLWQLLSPSVRIFTGKHVLTAREFTDTYKIRPHRWADVKALSGCDSDDIEGIRGIGEKTAVRFLRRELKPGCVAEQKITDGHSIWERNLDLITLPYPGTAVFELLPDGIDGERWDDYCRQRGFKSLYGAAGRRGERRLFDAR